MKRFLEIGGVREAFSHIACLGLHPRGRIKPMFARDMAIGKAREKREINADHWPWRRPALASRLCQSAPACFKYIHKIIRILKRDPVPARRFPHCLQKRDIGITTDIVAGRRA